MCFGFGLICIYICICLVYTAQLRGLPGHCPEMFGKAPFQEFYFPKYFAGDYFQRVPFNGYQHSWPSLFIGANGTESSMHVDSGGTNFWMYLLSGRKEWRFFDRSDMIYLYSERWVANNLTRNAREKKERKKERNDDDDNDTGTCSDIFYYSDKSPFISHTFLILSCLFYRYNR